MSERNRVLLLCGGLQSSGSTVISWCFLQRPDTDGFLDADNDLLPPILTERECLFTWYKTTISCFRIRELIAHYEDRGWRVRPLLVVRDIRRVWDSLCRKSYARDSITAEDPPLRMRLRRFKEDWELFRLKNWPRIRYESFLASPKETLSAACAELGLPWNDAMVTWPKSRDEITNTRNGNPTFLATCRRNLAESIVPKQDPVRPVSIAQGDLDWLETEFRDFNRENGYPEHLPANRDQAAVSESAGFLCSRRYKWELRRKPLRWLFSKFGHVPSRDGVNGKVA